MRIPFSYIWRSLWARRLTTALTLGGVALVVFVFAGVLMLAQGLEATLVETGSPENAIVLRRAAGSELVSQIDGGTGFDSEIWGDADQLMQAFGRPVYSSVTLRLRDPAQFDVLKARLQADPRSQSLEVKREQDFYREQSQAMAKFIKILGLVVTTIFSVGAMIGAMITMYAAVANRVVEVGTLRALGFRRRSVLGAFLVESVLLATVGGAAGIGLASLLSFARVSTLNFGSFSEIGFGFALSPGVITSALIFAVVMGVVGGFLPAVRAARLDIVSALRAS